VDIQAYIASGKLEDYLLGLCTDAEAQEVESMANQHPEVREALAKLEEDLAIYAQAKATPMPEGLTRRILDQVDKEEGKGDPLRLKGIANLPGMLLGFLTLAVGALAFYFWQQQLEADKALEQSQETLQALETDCAEKDQQIARLESQLDILRATGNQSIFLEGTPQLPQAVAAVHYNPKAKTTYFDFVELPTPPEGQQYQLWAIVDATPTDMGVLPLDPMASDFMEVPFIADAQAFAITLENVGGSAQPTLDQMVLLGTVGKG
jgi:hypothetical protein